MINIKSALQRQQQDLERQIQILRTAQEKAPHLPSIERRQSVQSPNLISSFTRSQDSNAQYLQDEKFNNIMKKRQQINSILQGVIQHSDSNKVRAMSIGHQAKLEQINNQNAYRTNIEEYAKGNRDVLQKTRQTMMAAQVQKYGIYMMNQIQKQKQVIQKKQEEEEQRKIIMKLEDVRNDEARRRRESWGK